ncbi:MAG: hypothetical protein EOP84_22230 [Verrucomicrobiaceae bacterium]|nr:MAG: hypothetical protein EOP84_22230 [Verrucomicrobiaceae bacterium]
MFVAVAVGTAPPAFALWSGLATGPRFNVVGPGLLAVVEVTVERLGEFDPLLPGRVSPIRLVPIEIYREKQRSIDNTAVCWFIRPAYGPPEGYTEMDFEVSCPEIQLETGADDTGSPLYTVLPSLTYKPFSGLSITSVPTSVKLGVDAPDVTVINFDKTKLRREYYEEAQVRVFEVPVNGDRSKAMLYLSGTIGNCEGNELEATIELTPWDEVTNLPTGWSLGFECDVGRLPGEEFGTMRCLNLKKLDGVDIADWTRGAEIESIVSLSRLVLTPHTVNSFVGFENDFPGSHGIIQFVGGQLNGLRRDVGNFNPSTGVIDLRRALPLLPEIGAQLKMKAGCDRSFNGPQGCVFWQQGRNFRRTPHLPGRKALRRRIDT